MTRSEKGMFHIKKKDTGSKGEMDIACASPKFCPALKSTACTLSSAAGSAMTGAHVPLRRIMAGPAHSLLAVASKPAPRKSRSAATAGRAEA